MKKELNEVVKLKLARLLASENLTLEYANVNQPSFDPVERILLIPNWATENMDIHDVLLCNEIAHALYTPHEYNTDFEGYENKEVQIFNIIEDYRVYKEICKKYPGMVNTFKSGYKAIVDADFFGLSKIAISDVSFADRVNIHLKVGNILNIPFTEKEQSFLATIKMVKTYQDSKVMANALSNLTMFGDKSPFVPKKRFHSIEYYTTLRKTDAKSHVTIPSNYDNCGYASINPGSGSGIDESLVEGDIENIYLDPNLVFNSEEYDELEEGDDFDDVESFLNSSSDVFTQDELKKSTEKISNNSDKESLTTYYRLQGTDKYSLKNWVVPFTKVLSDIEEANLSQCRYSNTGKIKYDEQEHIVKSWNQFNTDSKTIVSNMIKIFETKKSANLYKRSLIDNTGVLDTNKVYNYNITDDIFKRNIVMPEDKNHGMIFFLDWSGSMKPIIHSVVKQLLYLVSFCKKRNIPFVVYGMSSNDNIKPHHIRHERNGVLNPLATNDYELFDSNSNGLIKPRYSLSLIEFFSSKMSTKQFETQLKNLFVLSSQCHVSGYELQSTPLNDTLILADLIIKDFQKKYGVEKLNVITMTDGESDFLLYNRTPKSVLQDYKNCKSYEFQNQNELTGVLIKNLKDKYPNVKFINFDICYDLRSSYSVKDRTHIRNELDKNKYVNITDSFYDLFVIFHPKLFNTRKVVKREEYTSRVQIKNYFMSIAKKSKNNKKVLSEFIEYIA